MQGWVSPPPTEDGYYRYSKADKLIEFWRTYHGDIDIMQNVSGGTYASEPYFINLEAFVQLATGRNYSKLISADVCAGAYDGATSSTPAIWAGLAYGYSAYDGDRTIGYRVYRSVGASAVHVIVAEHFMALTN